MTETENPDLFYEESEEERMIKEQIAVRERKEEFLVRELRRVRGDIEELRRRLEKK